MIFRIHGLWGILVGLLTFPVLWLFIHGSLPKDKTFNLDPLNERGTFEPFLAKYLRLGEFVVGIAAGSIVLLGGVIDAAHAACRTPALLFVAALCIVLVRSVGNPFYGLAALSL